MKLTFNETFVPKYNGKLFKVKPAQVSYTIELDVDPITPEGKDIQRLVESHWKKEMVTFKKDKEKLYSEAIAITEKNLLKTFKKQAEKIPDPKKLQYWLEEECKGANIMIKNAIKTFEATVKSRAEKMYENAATAVDKKYKSDLRKRKFKAALKIGAHVTLILVVGALAIAATATGVAITVATGGVGVVSFGLIAPAVLGMLGTSYNSSKKIYSTIQKEWPNLDKATEKLEKSTKDLLDAVAYTKRKKLKQDTTGRKLNIKERYKLLMADVKGKVKTVEESLQACNSYCGSLRQNIEKMAKDVNKMQEQIDKMMDAAKKDPSLKKKVDVASQKQADLLYKIDKARENLGKLDPLVRKGMKLVRSTDLEDENKLKTFLRDIQSFAKDDSVKALVSAGKETITVVGSFISSVT